MPREFSQNDLDAIERTTQDVGRQVFSRLERKGPSVFQRRWWDDRIMAWAMKDEDVKVQLFRFIDVLPMLQTRPQVTEHLIEYLKDVSHGLPWIARGGLKLASPDSILGKAIAVAARQGAMRHARRFIAGTNADQVLAAARKARKKKLAFTLDLLGEAVITEHEADKYLAAFIDLIGDIAPQVNAWPEVPQIDRGVMTELPRVNVSIKLSALDSQFDAIDQAGTIRRVSARLRELLRVARRHRAFVNVDMESYATKDTTLAIFKQVMLEDEFRRSEDIGIVIQCYLEDSARDLAELRDWAAARGTPVWVRLVKGAYWDYETVHARYHGWSVPVYQQKWRTDANFEACVRFVLANHEHLRPAIGSHNIRSMAHAIAVARHIGLPPLGLELQMLYGMADSEKEIFAEMGHRLRVYMPFGELIPGMAYLVRRLLENTSNDSFLRASFTEMEPVEELLKKPVGPACRTGPEVVSETGDANIGRGTSRIEIKGLARQAGPTEDTDMPDPFADFRNEPPADFAKADEREKMQEALKWVGQRQRGFFPLVIGGQSIETAERIKSLNPSHKSQVVGESAAASAEQARIAVAAAKKALAGWSATPVEQRADYLKQAAAVMRRRRFELAAWMTFECGKQWREADGDVCEAIDFCEYYARGAVALQGHPYEMDAAGEENALTYLPRGVTAIIAPWNFPLAILTGMAVAALATGNTVIMKPAKQSPVIAAKLMEVFDEIGLPPGVANYLPGHGEVIGPPLTEHPDVTLIAFTGSRAVGLSIHRKAAEVSGVGGSRDVKQVIAEMGGKNAVIIDEDADLDEAVAGVVYSAFGYQGQKCSACSRLILLASIHDTFLERLVAATKSLAIRPAEDPGCRVGPVIDEGAYKRIKNYIEIGRKEGREVLAMDCGELADEGYYIAPHIFADIKPIDRIAQEEIFGPVLAVLKAKNLDEAFEIANGTDYALTGGMYSRSPKNLDRARREFRVGNVYLNRPCTGALVGRHPFGGFRMSGIGSKAGGPDYLLQFVVPQTVSENTMRRGFAPKEETEE